jgi:D-inositol-3-phosphate glycosyltransferase
MHIGLIITSTGWGGLEMNTLKLATLLSVRDYKITLFTSEKSSIYEKQTGQFDEIVLLEKPKKYLDFKTAKKIAKVLTNKKIDKILVVDNKDLDLVSWAKRIHKPKLKIYYQQHMQLGINKKDLIHTFRFKSIDTWISPLNYLKAEISKRTRYPIERVKVAPIGVDTDKLFKNQYSKEQALNLLGIKPKHPLLGIIGRISEKKGQLFVLQVLKQMIDQGQKAEVLIFGSPTVNDQHCKDYHEKLFEFVSSNNLKEYVHFIPFKEDVALFYSAVDIFMLASESETYGMVTIEAMLYSLPIVATASGGTTEILENGAYGLLYQQNDHKACREQILFHLNNPEQSIKMSRMAKQEAEQKYTHLIEIDFFDKLFTE